MILGLEVGGEMPTREQLIGLLGALLQERSLPALTVTDGALGAVNAADAFLRVEFVPHLVLPGDELPGDELEQCQSKMTYVVVRLVNGQGQPINGTTVQSGGLKLMVTLVNNTTGLTLQHNPKKPTQALLAGSAGGVYEPTAVLFESRHEFRFTIMVLSSELQGTPKPKLRVRVAPTCPDLAANANLCQETRPFVSRARMPDENERKKRKAAADTVFRSCGGVDGSDEDDEDASPQWVSLSAAPEGPDLEEEQEEEEDEAHPAPASARVQGVEARAKLQGMLDALESRHRMPTGPELADRKSVV